MSEYGTVIEAINFKNPTVLLIDITRLIEDFEVIQRALEVFLEAKRDLFPRFYFLSNDDLLEVLFNYLFERNLCIKKYF